MDSSAQKMEMVAPSNIYWWGSSDNGCATAYISRQFFSTTARIYEGDKDGIWQPTPCLCSDFGPKIVIVHGQTNHIAPKIVLS